MRTCKHCRQKTRGKCIYCGYENKRSSSETIYKKLIEYDRFLCKKYKDESFLRKKLWIIFKPLLNNLQKKLSQRGI